MQTFLPFEDFNKSAKCLDIKRLRCQIKETHQILNGQWKYHPTSKMWLVYHDALKAYFNTVLQEYKSRGFEHKFDFYDVQILHVRPYWLGIEAYHLSHMVNLLRKDFDHYSQYFTMLDDWEFPDGYYWPVVCGEKYKQGNKEWSEFVRKNPEVFDNIIVNESS